MSPSHALSQAFLGPLLPRVALPPFQGTAADSQVGRGPGKRRGLVQIRDDRGERERRTAGENGKLGEGTDCRRKRKEKVGKKGICKIKRQGPIRWCWARKVCYRQE